MKLLIKDYRDLLKKNYNKVSNKRKAIGYAINIVIGGGAITEGVLALNNTLAETNSMMNILGYLMIILGTLLIIGTFLFPAYLTHPKEYLNVKLSIKTVAILSFVFLWSPAFLYMNYGTTTILPFALSISCVLLTFDIKWKEEQDDIELSTEEEQMITELDLQDHRKQYYAIGLLMIGAGIIDVITGYQISMPVSILFIMVGAVLLIALSIPILRDALIGNKHHSLMLLYTVVTCIAIVYLYAHDWDYNGNMNILYLSFIPKAMAAICLYITGKDVYRNFFRNQ